MGEGLLPHGALSVALLMFSSAAFIGASVSASTTTFVAELESRGILETARSGNLSNEQRVEIIKLSYELLERHSQSTVSDLGFELSGFGFIGADEFQKIRYGDIVTLTGGDVIDMSRKRHTNGNTGAVTIEYIPVWGKHPGAAAQDVAGRRLETLSLAEVLEASKDHPELSAVSSATQYTVTVNLRGESRTYQAAFFWRPSVPGSEIAFYSVDLITQGVQEVALDPDLTVTRPLRGSSEEAKALGSALGTAVLIAHQQQRWHAAADTAHRAGAMRLEVARLHHPQEALAVDDLAYQCRGPQRFRGGGRCP